MLIVWGRGTASILQLGLSSAGLRLGVGIVHLVWVHVAHLLILTEATLLVGIVLGLVLAVALVLFVLVFICSPAEYC